MKLAKHSPLTSKPFDLVAYRSSIKTTSVCARIDELRTMRLTVEAKIIEAEAERQTGGLQASPDAWAIHARARELLGEKPTAEPRGFEDQVRSLRLDRDAIDQALEILGQKQTTERVQRLADELRARKNEWDDLNLNLALKLVECSEIERRRDEFKASLVGGPRLPCDVSLTHTLTAPGPIKTFLESAVRENIISSKEANP